MSVTALPSVTATVKLLPRSLGTGNGFSPPSQEFFRSLYELLSRLILIESILLKLSGIRNVLRKSHLSNKDKETAIKSKITKPETAVPEVPTITTVLRETEGRTDRMRIERSFEQLDSKYYAEHPREGIDWDHFNTGWYKTRNTTWPDQSELDADYQRH